MKSKNKAVLNLNKFRLEAVIVLKIEDSIAYSTFLIHT